jgi:hypothetical protein
MVKIRYKLVEKQGWTRAKKPPHRNIAEKASYHFKKTSIPLTMNLKSLVILEKPSISLKKS